MLEWESGGARWPGGGYRLPGDAEARLRGHLAHEETVHRDLLRNLYERLTAK